MMAITGLRSYVKFFISANSSFNHKGSSRKRADLPDSQNPICYNGGSGQNFNKKIMIKKVSYYCVLCKKNIPLKEKEDVLDAIVKTAMGNVPMIAMRYHKKCQGKVLAQLEGLINEKEPRPKSS